MNLFAQLKLRAWNESDIAAMALIEQEAYPYPWSAGIMRDCFLAGHWGWTAWSRGELAAYGVVQAVLDEAHLLNLCTAPSWQGQGIGRGILSFVMQQCAQREMQRMLLEVRASNTPALGLYRALGFVQDGVRKGYYPASGGREDAVLMSRSLGV
ncbi:MAG: ribosomal protein S18-alanine N-acetyltransferase [Pseudomonadota bacterium]